jgi:hypothetical protein
MTITEEIRYAMKDGTSTMFLLGLLKLFLLDPDAAIEAVETAGESVRRDREVRLFSHTGVKK